MYVQSSLIQTSCSHLIPNEELVVNGESHGITGTEPPHRPVDGVSCQPPLFCILFYQRYHGHLVPGDVGPS